MARPQKEGLEYFPLDVDIDQDDKVFFIEAKYGLTGFAVVIRLMMRIYNNGYYYNWGDKELLMFSKKVNVDMATISDIVNDCLGEGFFNKSIYDKYRVLTSNGIQKRYLEACVRRKEVEIDGRFLIVDISKYSNVVIVNNNECSEVVNVDINDSSQVVNAEIMPQSKEEKSKEKKSKEEKSKEDESAATSSISEDVFTVFNNNIHPITPIEAEQINDWLNDVEEEVIIAAIREAVNYNKRSWGYIKSVLNSWFNKGIKTAEDLKAYQRDRTDERNRDGPKQDREVYT